MRAQVTHSFPTKKPREKKKTPTNKNNHPTHHLPRRRPAFCIVPVPVPVPRGSSGSSSSAHRTTPPRLPPPLHQSGGGAGLGAGVTTPFIKKKKPRARRRAPPRIGAPPAAPCPARLPSRPVPSRAAGSTVSLQAGSHGVGKQHHGLAILSAFISALRIRVHFTGTEREVQAQTEVSSIGEDSMGMATHVFLRGVSAG